MSRSPRPARPRGVALISGLMVLVILLIIASAFVHLTARDVRSSQTVGDSLLTLYLAEAGLEYAMWLNKHNMALYPSITYNEKDASNVDYQIPAGSISNLLIGGGVTAQERVLINDLAFYPEYDFTEAWLRNNHHCGTFEVRQTVEQASGSTNIWIVRIVSIGRVRQVPQDWSWESEVLDRTDLASADWKVRSKRTLYAEVRLDTSTGALTDLTKSAEIEEARWYERFR